MNKKNDYDIKMTREMERNAPFVMKSYSIQSNDKSTNQTPPRTFDCQSHYVPISSQNRCTDHMELANLKCSIGNSNVSEQNLPLTPVHYSLSKSSAHPFDESNLRSSECDRNDDNFSFLNVPIGTPLSSLRVQKPQTPISGSFINKFSSFTPYQTPPSAHCKNSNSTPSQISLNQKMSSSMSTPRKVPLVVLAKVNSESEDNIKTEQVSTDKSIEKCHQEVTSPASYERFPSCISKQYPTPKKELNTLPAHSMHYINNESDKEMKNHLTDKYRPSPRGTNLKVNNCLHSSLHSHSTLFRDRKNIVSSSLSGISNISKDPSSSSTRMSMFGSAQSSRRRTKFTLAPKTSISLMPKMNARMFMTPSPKGHDNSARSTKVPDLDDISCNKRVVSEERPSRRVMTHKNSCQESHARNPESQTVNYMTGIDAKMNIVVNENEMYNAMNNDHEQDRANVTKSKSLVSKIAQEKANFDQSINCTNRFGFNPKKRPSSLLFEHSIGQNAFNTQRNFAPQDSLKSYKSHAICNAQNTSISPGNSQQDTKNSFPHPNIENDKTNKSNPCGMSSFVTKDFSITFNADEESQISSDLSDGDEDDFFLLMPSTIKCPTPPAFRRKDSTTSRPELRVISQCSIDLKTKSSQGTPHVEELNIL